MILQEKFKVGKLIHPPNSLLVKTEVIAAYFVSQKATSRGVAAPHAPTGTDLHYGFIL